MSNLPRRDFLRQSATALAGAAAAPYIITSSALGQGQRPAASERIATAHIGVGSRGGGLLGEFMSLPDVQCVAIVDCFASRREGVAHAVNQRYGGQGCTAYGDFREMLARDDIDAVVVATHDVWHVPLTTACARSGKDVYVEKPLGMSIEEDLVAREVCQRYGTVFQYGTQQRSMAHCRYGCELVRNGRLGEIKSIEVIAPQGGVGGSTEVIPVPEELDYDLWLGPAPWSPYTEDRCANRGGFWVYDNSIGFLAGWGSHPLDILDWAYGSDEMVPVECRGTGLIPTEGLYDTVATWDLQLRYPNGVPLAFKSGGGDLTRFVGTQGWLNISRGGLDADPKSLLTSPIGPDEIHLTESAGHARNFIDSVKSRTPAVSPIESATRSDIISHLGDIAIRTGRTIRWDPKAERIVGDDAASRMMTRPMRSPWRL
ncbi:MAG: Gfo/Idh/MocA family oxidoreductase [Armatimonadetes bacterium]|nr:Gfo/Idh/MocA family oxidoreductase [Armatimonadota bacterium]